MKTLQEQSDLLRDHANLIQERIDSKQQRIAELRAELEIDLAQRDLLNASADALAAGPIHASASVTPIRSAPKASHKVSAGDTKKVAKPTKKVAKTSAKAVTQKPREAATPKSGIPTLTARLLAVMAGAPTTVDDIILRLAQREGWTPNSKNLKSYISHQLSISAEFTNVGRGVYQETKAVPQKQPTAPKVAVAAPKAPKAPKAARVETAIEAAAVEAPAVKQKKVKRVPPAKRDKAALGKVISEQRKAVADGRLPTLRDRLIIVMEDKNLKVSHIIDLLSERNWLPDSGDLNTYISYQLSSDLDTIFRRTQRGWYEVINPVVPAQEEAAPKLAVTATKTNGVTNNRAHAPVVDPTPAAIEQELEDFGADGDFTPNPFV